MLRGSELVSPNSEQKMNFTAYGIALALMLAAWAVITGSLSENSSHNERLTSGTWFTRLPIDIQVGTEIAFSSFGRRKVLKCSSSRGNRFLKYFLGVVDQRSITNFRYPVCGSRWIDLRAE